MVMQVLGKEATVRERISYKEKMDVAEEYVAMVSVFDEERGICYRTPYEEAIGKYIMLKTYTDLDMTGYDNTDALCDLMDKIDAMPIDEFEKCVEKDWYRLMDLADTIYYNVEAAFKKTHSLEYRVKNSFGFLLDGKDLTETLAEAREINEQMIDHIGAMVKADKPIDMAQYAKKKK